MAYSNSVNNLFLNQKVVSVTGNYLVQDNDVIIEVGTITAPITITLPTSSPQNRGRHFLIQDSVGTAQINPILITAPSSMIDGASNYTIAQSYGSVQLFSYATGYGTYNKNPPTKQVIPLGRATWSGALWQDIYFTQTAFTIGGTVENWDTTPAPITSSFDPRIDFSRMKLYADRANLTLASDSRSMTITSPGMYEITVNSALLSRHPNTYPLAQLVKNGTVIRRALTYCRQGADMNGLYIFYRGNFAANDTIDLRYAAYAQGTAAAADRDNYAFFCLDVSIEQLPVYVS